MWLRAITILVLIASTTSKKLVDLSERGLKKEDFFMKIQSQINLQEVTDLILRKNEFDSFLDCSTNLANLEILDLSQNHLQRFFFLCKDEYNLRVLNVSHNKLEYIDDNAFNDRIPKLKILDLSSNKLSIVNETMLEHFKILEYLTLANNPINDGIHENAFWNLKALRYLNLSNVSSSYFSTEFFKTLTNLSTLDLSMNPISRVPSLPVNLEELDLSNTHISRLRDVYLPRLRELKLNNMQNLRELLLNDFENLTSLEILSLDGSRTLTSLKMIPYNDRLLPRLQRLSVSNCGLKTLDYNLMSIIKRTPILSFENNPWHCDCKMQWLNMLNATKALSRQIQCRTPEQHSNRQLSEIPSHELECEDDATMLHPVLWACIFILVVAIVLATGFFLLRRPLGHWDIRRKNRDTVTYTNVDESSNDLVRILAANETVERNDE
ncbi:leucine-rich repeat neuronal protein 1 isoform X3 [Bombus terrestris]|uniref:Leucine-rich repeat neuronal protein 1 isoform X3 n=1 Tax=Bombus terrestris TaxID=30195 RepID=A0A9B2MRA2_BOMTE|nr:leucine-rich repeat neuronal protein 1 isoform X3 [Bombus terrestris]